jgi:hypothetical protein
MPRKYYERNDMAWNGKVRHRMEIHGIGWKGTTLHEKAWK